MEEVDTEMGTGEAHGFPWVDKIYYIFMCPLGWFRNASISCGWGSLRLKEVIWLETARLRDT